MAPCARCQSEQAAFQPPQALHYFFHIIKSIDIYIYLYKSLLLTNRRRWRLPRSTSFFTFLPGAKVPGSYCTAQPAPAPQHPPEVAKWVGDADPENPEKGFAQALCFSTLLFDWGKETPLSSRCASRITSALQTASATTHPLRAWRPQSREGCQACCVGRRGLLPQLPAGMSTPGSRL